MVLMFTNWTFTFDLSSGIRISKNQKLNEYIERNKSKYWINREDRQRLMCHCVYFPIASAAFRKFFHLFLSHAFGSHTLTSTYKFILRLDRYMCSLFTTRMISDKRVTNAVSSIVPIDTLKCLSIYFDCHGTYGCMLCIPLIRAVCTAVFRLHMRMIVFVLYEICNERKRKKIKFLWKSSFKCLLTKMVKWMTYWKNNSGMSCVSIGKCKNDFRYTWMRSRVGVFFSVLIFRKEGVCVCIKQLR